MNIIPAIDIINGKCVRLYKGDFSKQTLYGDPVVIAKQWEEAGARRLHVVDLDGAKLGELSNFEIIKKIKNNVKIPIEVGGGIRNEESILKLLSVGIDRIIVTSLAFTTISLVKKYVNNIFISLDIKNNKLFSNGWTVDESLALKDAINQFECIGVSNFVYTDIAKDGTLSSPDYLTLKKVLQLFFRMPIVSGGITSTKDIQKLKKFGIEEIIVGKALYENKFTLQEALSC